MLAGVSVFWAACMTPGVVVASEIVWGAETVCVGVTGSVACALGAPARDPAVAVKRMAPMRAAANACCGPSPRILGGLIPRRAAGISMMIEKAKVAQAAQAQHLERWKGVAGEHDQRGRDSCHEDDEQ